MNNPEIRAEYANLKEYQSEGEHSENDQSDDDVLIDSQAKTNESQPKKGIQSEEIKGDQSDRRKGQSDSQENDSAA